MKLKIEVPTSIKEFILFLDPTKQSFEEKDFFEALRTYYKP